MSYANNLADNFIFGTALAVQTVNAAATANGATIVKPGRRARKIAFFLMAGALNSVTVLTIKVQRNPGTGWVDVLDENNNPLQFTAAKTIDNAALENGILGGSLDLTRTGDGDYRLQVSTVTGANVTLSASFVLHDLYQRPAVGVDDDLYIRTVRE